MSIADVVTPPPTYTLSHAHTHTHTHSHTHSHMHSIIRYNGVPEGGSRLVEVSSCSAALSPVASLSPAYIHIHTPASDREKPFPRGGWQSCSDVAKNSISSGVAQSESVSEQSSQVAGCSCLSWRSLLMTRRRVAFPVKMQMPVVLWTTCTCCCWQLPQTLHEHPPCAFTLQWAPQRLSRSRLPVQWGVYSPCCWLLQEHMRSSLAFAVDLS